MGDYAEDELNWAAYVGNDPTIMVSDDFFKDNKPSYKENKYKLTVVDFETRSPHWDCEVYSKTKLGAREVFRKQYPQIREKYHSSKGFGLTIVKIK